MTYRIDEIPNRSGKPAILLRRHWREGKRIRKETVANLTRHPAWLAEIMFQKFCKMLSLKFGHGKSFGFANNHPLQERTTP